MIAPLPFDAGAVNTMLMVVLPPLPTTPVGTPGTATFGVAVLLSPLHAESEPSSNNVAASAYGQRVKFVFSETSPTWTSTWTSTWTTKRPR